MIALFISYHFPEIRHLPKIFQVSRMSAMH